MFFGTEFAEKVKATFPDVEVRECNHLKLVGGYHGWHFTFKNGFVASIQFGPGSYSDNYHTSFMEERPLAGTSSTAEIAGWYGKGEMITFPDWSYTVKGWQSVEQVMSWLMTYANKEA